eukprot:NODE_495_length_7749_cov_0.107974.p5 type:complete len:189 gc:universal NODE_495_length_7749_cov_0.107974:2810-3376(+)
MFNVFYTLVLGATTDLFRYGNYCGAGHGLYEITGDKECLARLFTEDDCIPPIDLLDTICFWHDLCFRYSQQKNGFDNSCNCNKAILDSNFDYSIPLPIAYNFTDDTVIFDEDSSWPVPYRNESLFDGSPVKWAQGYCQNIVEYPTTVGDDTNIKSVDDNTVGKCNAAGFVAVPLTYLGTVISGDVLYL